MLPPQHDAEEAVATETRLKIERPKLYKVILHNDDFTTMEFVVHVLESIFGLGESDAFRVMLEVHVRGAGVAGTFTYEIAEMKVSKTLALAKAHEFPLMCTMEEDG